VKNFLLLFFFIIFSHCSLNSNSTYWTEDPKGLIKNDQIINEIKLKDKDITEMTFDEYRVYLKELNKSLPYPEIE